MCVRYISIQFDTRVCMCQRLAFLRKGFKRNKPCLLSFMFNSRELLNQLLMSCLSDLCLLHTIMKCMAAGGQMIYIYIYNIMISYDTMIHWFNHRPFNYSGNGCIPTHLVHCKLQWLQTLLPARSALPSSSPSPSSPSPSSSSSSTTNNNNQ